MKIIMANLEPISKAWDGYIERGEISKWCDSLILLLEIFHSDSEFKGQLIGEANEVFTQKLNDEDKSDVFFFLLSKIK